MEDKYSKALLSLKKNGWGIIPEFCDDKICLGIKESLTNTSVPVNLNRPIATFIGKTKFNTNVLACSKDAVDVVLSQKLRDLCTEYLGEEPILKCVRSYTINKKSPLFTWHADNVNPLTFESDQSKGINFILYLDDDIKEKTFWVAENIFNDNSRITPSPTPDELLKWKNENRIVKVIAQRGDIVIFRQDIFHQHVAREIDKLDALWFQMVDKSFALNEKIIIDPSYLPLDNKVLEFLGTGRENIEISNPVSQVYNLTTSQLIKIGIYCFAFIPASIFITLGKRVDKILFSKLGIDLIRFRKFFRKQVHRLVK